MIDKEKVIKGLEHCKTGRCDSRCPYNHINVGCRKQLDEDILALLKEQEKQIEQLEYDLAVTQNNLNYYVNGND